MSKTIEERKDDRLLSIDEVSEIIGTPVPSLYHLRRKGGGPPLFKVGRNLKCWESDLYEWLRLEQLRQTASGLTSIEQ